MIGKRFTARLWNNGVGPSRVYIAVDLYFASSTALNGQNPQKMHIFRRWLTVYELRHEFFELMAPFCAADGAPNQGLYDSIFANLAAGIEIYKRPQTVEGSHSEAYWPILDGTRNGPRASHHTKTVWWKIDESKLKIHLRQQGFELGGASM